MPVYKEDWWHTDEQGRRVGWMTPEQFEGWINSIYPTGKAPRLQFANAMGMDVSKISRWMTGKDPIPKWVAHLPELWRRASPHYDFNKSPEAPWLPFTDSVNGRQAQPDEADTRDPRGRQSRKAA